MAFTSPLEALEAALAELQAALVASDPEAVGTQAQAVRSAMSALSDWAAKTPASQWPPGMAARARHIGEQLGNTREQLARVLAVTRQQAASLLPPADALTYGPGADRKAGAYRGLP